MAILIFTLTSFSLMIKEMLDKQNPDTFTNLEFTPNPEVEPIYLKLNNSRLLNYLLKNIYLQWSLPIIKQFPS